MAKRLVQVKFVRVMTTTTTYQGFKHIEGESPTSEELRSSTSLVDELDTTATITYRHEWMADRNG